MSWDKTVEKVISVGETLNKLDEALRSAGDRQWYFKKMAGYTKALFEKFAPFKVEDRVQLTKTPDINPEQSWGWMGAKHFLVKGAKGTVIEVDLDPDALEFTALVEFDEESWIPTLDSKDHQKGVPVLMEEKNRHVYFFREDFLEKQKKEVPKT